MGIAFDENLSTKELNDLLYKPDAQNRFNRAFNMSGCKGKISVAYNAADPAEEAEITIAEDIGKDAWTGDGINLKDIQDALGLVQPKTRALNFKIDSQVGSYNVGCSIHNEL